MNTHPGLSRPQGERGEGVRLSTPSIPTVEPTGSSPPYQRGQAPQQVEGSFPVYEGESSPHHGREPPPAYSDVSDLPAYGERPPSLP